jgi:hypothetical protein
MGTMKSLPQWPARPTRGVEPQIIRTMGSVLLGAFAVVLIVSVTTIARHGTGAYDRVMGTLGLSLIALLAAILLSGWIVGLMRPEENGPRNETQQLRDEIAVLTNELVELRRDAADRAPRS